jgi:subtilase family serine protease
MKLNRWILSSVLPLAALLLLVLSLAPGRAQTAEQNRITGSLSNGQTAVLLANVSPLAQKQYDQGPVESSLQMNNMTLMIKPTAAQQASLNQLIAAQQQKNSPNYHQWLTPTQYGDRFGLSQTDVGTLSSWLQSKGFTVDKVANGRNWITFSGTAAQVQNAFKTEIHHYLVDGELHYANVAPPSIPMALIGIVSDIRDLTDFRPKAPRRQSVNSGVKPMYTSGPVGPGDQFLAPADIQVLYDSTHLYASNITGTGVKLVIVGQTDIDPSDITDFQTSFGYTAIPPTVVLYGPDPGSNPNDETEADLDLEWSWGAAQGASIYYANSTNVFDSVQNAIDANLGQVISMSYGGCELDNMSFLASEQVIAQQAVAQGMTWLAATGDSGAAGCDSTIGLSGLQVNFPASIPEVTGVGGNEFNENGNYDLYWSATNGSNGASALSYIPEIAWNDTTECLQDPQCDQLEASGGGVSTFYPLPTYQTGVSGIQGTGFRNVPDIALSASPNNDGYLICAIGSCDSPTNTYEIVGGTSASTPTFAGFVALLNQYLVTQGSITAPGLGNINPTLYPLLQSTPLAFHDINTGNNIVPCQTGSTGCPASGSYGYNAGTGYDPVTGLGSVDANVLITNWVPSAPGTPTTTTLTAKPTSASQGASVTLTATVTPASGPTGTVTFFVNKSTSLGVVNLASGIATLVTTTLPPGSDSVTASYSGDATFAASTSAAVIVTVCTPPFCIGTSAANPVSQGGTATSTVTVTSAAGFTGTVTFACTAGLPAEATCTFTPASVTPPANGTVTSTLSIATVAPSAVFGYRRNPESGPGPQAPLLVLVIGLLGMMGLAATYKWLPARRTSLRWPVMAAIVILATVGMVSCGSSGSSGNAGTPVGSYTVAVTGTSGSTSITVNVPLSVNAAAVEGR